MQLSDFIQNISKNRWFLPNDPLMVAVSGGVDSVVLCELCHRAGFIFQMAHVNFRLRGQESDDDEKLVRELATQYGVLAHVKHVDTREYAKINKLSVQVAARELRYRWFDELLQEHGKYLLTAHHADDNIETVVMNFFRGTGITGLRGILPVSGKIIRPLLSFPKKEILAFANEHSLKWREDSSNASEKYSRNYFRNTILPLVTEVFPEAAQNLLNNIERFRDVELLYQQAMAVHRKKLLVVKGSEVHIPILKLKLATPLLTIVHECIRPYHFSSAQAREVLRLLDAEQGKYIESATHRILKNRNWLIISPLTTDVAEHIVIGETDREISFQEGILRLKQSAANGMPVPGSILQACLDTRKLKYPLILRKWRSGDYFYPLGMAKKKKVSRFLIDQKTSRGDKERTWVLESDKKICWVVGKRIDDRFKITGQSKNMLVISLETQ